VQLLKLQNETNPEAYNDNVRQDS